MIFDPHSYREVFHQVREIVLANDPIGLVDGGAPDDEYDTEIGLIISAIIGQTDAEIIAQEVGNTFNKEFGGSVDVSREQCLAIARGILRRFPQGVDKV